MSYYEYTFVLSIEPLKSFEMQFEIIKELKGVCRQAYEILDDNGCSPPDHKFDWVDANKDLRSFSKRYPDLVFRLDYDGIEFHDCGSLFVKNGSSYEAEFVPPDFDESLLSKC